MQKLNNQDLYFRFFSINLNTLNLDSNLELNNKQIKTWIVVLAVANAFLPSKGENLNRKTVVKAQLTGQNPCTCPELTQQTDCQSAGCAWVTVNGSSSCNAATTSSTPTCSNYTSQQSCDARSGCAWTNAGVCAAFTKCSDYTITSTANAAQCYLKDSTCVPGTASGQTVPCTTGTYTCSNVTDSTVCSQLVPTSTTVCWWSTTCISQDVTKCSTITDATVCGYHGCTYTNSACSAPTCAGVNGSASCTYIQADTFGQVQICSWNSSICADAADTSTLTAANCFTNTGGTYKWNGSTCSACSGSSSNAILLALSTLLISLMF